MKKFDKFVGIDWSGAKGKYHHGIQVAKAKAGTEKAPKLICPPQSEGWSRKGAIKYLLDLKNRGHHVLAGIDFAFAHPFSDDGYFPQYPDESLPLPSTPQELWKLVDEVNNGWDHFYGGGIWGHKHLRQYYNAPESSDGRGGIGKLYNAYGKQQRVTEKIATSKYKGLSPSSSFNSVGAAGVGTGSLAGMRVLHCLKDHASIWPFTSLRCDNSKCFLTLICRLLRCGMPKDSGSLTLVEIYPAIYFKMASVENKSANPLKALNDGLDYFNSDRLKKIPKCLSKDDIPHAIDAAISAAALRDLHKDAFCIDPAHRQAAMKEGWIFGVGREESKK